MASRRRATPTVCAMKSEQAAFGERFRAALKKRYGTIDNLNKAFVAALEAPTTKTRYNTLLAEPTPTTPAQFDQFMASERAKYEKVVKASGATVD